MKNEGKILAILFVIGIVLVLSVSIVSASLLTDINNFFQQLFGKRSDNYQGELGEVNPFTTPPCECPPPCSPLGAKYCVTNPDGTGTIKECKSYLCGGIGGGPTCYNFQPYDNCPKGCDPITNQCKGCTSSSCNDNNACTTDTCDSSTGNCVYTPKTCNDNNFCTTDTCNPSTGCVYATKTCNDFIPCTTDSCDSGNGNCIFTPKTCNDNNFCTIDSCNTITGECTHASRSCEDNNLCTTDSCNNYGCYYTLKNCNDNNACTTDSCDSLTGNCVNIPKTCNDNNLCTTDTCTNGVCKNTPINCPVNKKCIAGTCVCDNKCVYGNSKCNGNKLVSCVSDSDGCLNWDSGEDCSSGKKCEIITEDSAMCVCDHKCNTNEKKCEGDKLLSCITDSSGCRIWDSGTDCKASGKICKKDETANIFNCVCDNRCKLGEERCNGNDIQICEANSNGCYDWGKTYNCYECQKCTNINKFYYDNKKVEEEFLVDIPVTNEDIFHHSMAVLIDNKGGLEIKNPAKPQKPVIKSKETLTLSFKVKANSCGTKYGDLDIYVAGNIPQPRHYRIIVFIPCNPEDKVDITSMNPQCMTPAENYGNKCSGSTIPEDKCLEETPKFCYSWGCEEVGSIYFNSFLFEKVTGIPIKFLNIPQETDLSSIEGREFDMRVFFGILITTYFQMSEKNKGSISSITYDFKQSEKVGGITLKDGSITIYPAALPLLGGSINPTIMHEACHALDFKLDTLIDKNWWNIAREGFPSGYDYYYIHKKSNGIFYSIIKSTANGLVFYDGTKVPLNFALYKPYAGTDFLEDKAESCELFIKLYQKDFLNGDVLNNAKKYKAVLIKKLNWLCEKGFIPEKRCKCNRDALNLV